MSVQRPTPTLTSRRASTDRGMGLHAETAQLALDSHLKSVMQCSDQCHWDCFRYS